MSSLVFRDSRHDLAPFWPRVIRLKIFEEQLTVLLIKVMGSGQNVVTSRYVNLDKRK